jgi:signal transduction histidine kinase
VRSGSGPNELRRLTHSFDRMAATVSDAMTAQRAFVADASHQLRNPLTALRLRLQLLDECLQGPSAEHYLAAVEETERLRSMLDDLLALARTEASTAAPASRVRLDDVVADRLQAWCAAADAQNLDLHHTPSGLAVLMAPATIATALDAVLDNALKVTPGPGVVAVTARRTRDGQVELAVQDTGPGLTDDELARAPDRFWRSPRHQNVPVSGLGLAIVQRSLRAAGGDTRLERPGQGGLRVVLTLPAAPDEPPAPSPWPDHRLVDQSLLPDHSSSDSR